MDKEQTLQAENEELETALIDALCENEERFRHRLNEMITERMIDFGGEQFINQRWRDALNSSEFAEALQMEMDDFVHQHWVNVVGIAMDDWAELTDEERQQLLDDALKDN